MAKPTKDEAQEAWREAEVRYQTLITKYVDGVTKLDKDAALAITKARTKADRRMADYFRRCLD